MEIKGKERQENERGGAEGNQGAGNQRRSKAMIRNGRKGKARKGRGRQGETWKGMEWHGDARKYKERQGMARFIEINDFFGKCALRPHLQTVGMCVESKKLRVGFPDRYFRGSGKTAPTPHRGFDIFNVGN